MVGGGSGGHVTPLKAVAVQIKKLKPETTLELVTDSKFFGQAKEIFKDLPEVKIKKIQSGKFRRYNSKSFFWHITHLPTILKNLFDVVRVIAGTVQVVIKFIFDKPDVIFSKGGFVSVPVGVAAHIYKIPLIIHDSDTHAGLSSRVISRWADKIATGMPTNYYSYPEEKTIYTGIPVDDTFTPISSKMQTEIKHRLGLEDLPLLVVTGGGTGAERINSALERVGEELLGQGWQIVQVTGAGKSEPSIKVRDKIGSNKEKNWHIKEFVDLRDYLLAADVVVTRTGATTMQELANTGKTVITIPSRFLSGGHQLKNAQMFEDAGAVRVLDEQILEQKPTILTEAIETALVDSTKDRQLATNLHEQFAKPDAARVLARLILDL
jgi:UDP-N-acetylglucosamine--N-acetylmuramyl-(pentapeptide) pyrophosphoryl-undecaprenol N-acetylglucosamine transferase